MKKFISCFLALIMIFGCFSLCAAADGYTKAFLITVEEDSAKKIRLVPVECEADPSAAFGYSPVYNEDGTAKIRTDSEGKTNTYVEDGKPFFFYYETLSDNKADYTTRLRAFPASHYLDIVEGADFDDAEIYDSEEDTYGILEALGTDSAKHDIFVIPAVKEDKVVGVYNMQSKSIASVKETLLEGFQFFIELIKWFFGLRADFPTSDIFSWGKAH